MSEMIVNDAIVIEGLEACFFDDDFVQNDVVRGKESTGKSRRHLSRHKRVLTLALLQSNRKVALF